MRSSKVEASEEGRKIKKKRQRSPNEAFHQQQLTGVDMKRDTRTKVYPTDADATKKKQTSYNHTTSGLMLSSKVQAGEEGRKITKKTPEIPK